jgi:hypothetical protein
MILENSSKQISVPKKKTSKRRLTQLNEAFKDKKKTTSSDNEESNEP